MRLNPPTIGAAISILDLARLRPWFLERPRDLELQDFCFASVLDGDWQHFVDAAKPLLDGFGGRLGIHGPFSGFEIDSRDPGVRDVIIKRMDQTLDVADALGATQIVIHSPYTFWDYHNIDLKPRGRAKKAEAVHACLHAAVKRAEDQGVTFVIENIQDIDPDDRLDLARGLGSPAVKLSVDTGHAHFCHVTMGAPDVAQFIRQAGAHLSHVHLQDVDGRADQHWAIGEGTINWPDVFAALADIQVNPHLVLELNDTSGILPSMRALDGLAV